MFVFLTVGLSVFCFSACLAVFLTFCYSVFLSSVRLSVRRSIRRSVFPLSSLRVDGNVPGGLVWILLFVCISVFLSFCLFVSLSLCLSVSLSLCISVFMSVCLSVILIQIIYLRCGFPQGGRECSRRPG